jgi:DinB superfamily
MKSQENIAQGIDEVLDIYKTGLESYSDAVFEYKHDDDTWSLGQMYEHIFSSSQKFFLANAKRCLEQRNGQDGGEPNEKGKQLMAAGAFPNIKIKVPEAVKSIIIAEPKKSYFEAIEIVRNSAQAMKEQLKQDAGTYRIAHPVFGFLNATEWFLNLEMHNRHHLKQKAELEALANA